MILLFVNDSQSRKLIMLWFRCSKNNSNTDCTMYNRTIINKTFKSLLFYSYVGYINYMINNLLVLQKGIIYFLYRPKVETEKVKTLQDVQKIYLLLKPSGYSKYIQIIAAKKQLPDDSNITHFAFVELVTANKKILNKNLGEEEYYTGTRGFRHQARARILGEGKYLIVLHNGHTHLVYQLIKPSTAKEPQRNVKINEEGAFIISIKNPLIKMNVTIGLPSEKKAVYPKKLQNKFGNQKFIPLNPADFLKYAGTEILLIGQKTEKSKKLFEDVKQTLSLLPMDEISEIFSSLHNETATFPIFEDKLD